jgi:hypothetical protein
MPYTLPADPSAPTPVDTRAARIAAVIRNGLSNGPIAQSHAAWDHLQTRLGEIVRAILEEI